MIKPFGLRSNWEIIVFYFIEPLVNEKKRHFYRQHIIKDVEDIVPMLRLLGHKKNPQKIEETFQSTLNNMCHKKGWINFIGGGYTGQYELTDDGYKVLLSIKEHLENIRNARNEIKTLKNPL